MGIPAKTLRKERHCLERHSNASAPIADYESSNVGCPGEAVYLGLTLLKVMTAIRREPARLRRRTGRLHSEEESVLPANSDG